VSVAKRKEPSTDEIESMVRGAGLRRTTSRVEVVRTIARSRSPMSHPDVIKALAAHAFDRVTLYRNLLDLADVGVLRRTDHGDHVWRYELASDDTHAGDHLHFVCTDCGSVSCLAGVTIDIRATSRAPRSVRSRRVKVQLSGRCDHCAKPM
jgi:Fur family ferric uptake transcriptional regulator